MLNLDFTGKTVLVTGSSRHTGMGIARAFLKSGARVGINSPNPENVAKAIQELKAEGLENTVDAAANIADEAQVEAMFERIGAVDLLVNNACHLGVGHGVLDTSAAFWDEVMGVNARGYFLCSKAAALRMRERGGGCIVNISSTCSMRILRNRAAYCASKGAVDALTRCMAVELIPYNIRVNAIALGYVHTSRWEGISDNDATRRRANIPSGREVDYDEVAATIMFLASPGAKNIVGDVITLDGGVDAQLLPKDCEV